MKARSKQKNGNRNRRPMRFESLEQRRLMAIDLFSSTISDASGDTTEQTVFQDGVLRASATLWIPSGESLESTRVHATSRNSTWILPTQVLHPPHGKPVESFSEVLVDLSAQTLLPPGRYEMQIEVLSSTGESALSTPTSIRILDTTQIDGSFKAELFDLSEDLIPANTGIVLHGQGGTDTMYLAGLLNDAVTLNGQSVKRFNSEQTDALPVHQGYAVDHLVLSNGSEVYFTGIDRISGPLAKGFPTGVSIDLSVRPNDPEFPNQWNLHVSDVPSAWRFTTGSEDVLLVSIDTGVLPRREPTDAFGKVTDLSVDGLITEPLDGVETQSQTDERYGHGHMSISVMSGTPNNEHFIAGINWQSDVLVANVYAADMQANIRKALEYGREAGKKIVFQGGFQGEYWLTSGGTQAELESLIAGSQSDAVFAIAAGNGYIPVEQTSPLTSWEAEHSGGVARLQSSHPNLMSVGALQSSLVWPHGLANANASDVHRADSSNHGRELTLMGATDSPAVDLFSDIQDPWSNTFEPGVRNYTGTSAANPNIAGIASLVWSVNNRLTGNQIREILVDTAMDNLPNGDGHSFLSGAKDYEYGHGLANADLAVRRALAMRLNSTLVELVSADNVVEVYPGKRYAAVDPSSTSQKASLNDDAVLQYTYQLPDAPETRKSKYPLRLEQPGVQIDYK